MTGLKIENEYLKLISDSETLKKLCNKVSTAPYIAVDTEFLRDKTYYPILCVVQIASNDTSFAVDMLATDVDFEPLYQLFHNSKIMKLFHSGRQDVEIIYKLSGKIPHPIFDTQVAAMVLGYGEAVSYAKLIQDYLGISLDKSMQFTDWALRPLLKKQIEYALHDVIYLCEIYKTIKKDLEKSGRASWIDEEMLKLTNEQNYIKDPNDIWLKLRPKNQDPVYLARLQYLFKWREEEAIAVNRPRAHIIKDQGLLDIAMVNPKNIKMLKAINSLGNLKPSYHITILELVEQANSLPPSKLPEPLTFDEFESGKDFPVLALLKLALKIKSKEYNVAEKLIATSDDLKSILTENKHNSALMQGWRYEVFGKVALKIIKGKAGIKAKANDLEIYRIWF